MKILNLSFALFLLIGCANKSSDHTVHWKEGDSLQSYNEMVAQLNKLEWSSKQTTQFAGYKIEMSSQVISGNPVLETSRKEVTRSATESVYFLASQYKQKSLFQGIMGRLDQQYSLLNFLRKNPEFEAERVIKMEPVFHYGEEKLQAVFRMEYADKMGVRELLIDSHFKVIADQIVSSEFDAQATVFPKGPKHSNLTRVLLQDLEDLTQLISSRVSVSSDATDSVLNLKEPQNYDPQDLRFDQVQAYYALDASLKWFETRFGYKPNQKIQAVVHLDYPEKTNAAFYYGGKIRLGTGDGEAYSHIAQDPSIVIHESGHSVVEAVAHLPFQGEGGSLNEGFADFFAAVQLQNPRMGESSYLKGPFKRNLASMVTLEEKNGGLYHDSLILSSLLWELYTTFGDEKGLKIAARLLVDSDPGTRFSDIKEDLAKILPEILDASDLKKAQAILAQRGF